MNELFVVIFAVLMFALGWESCATSIRHKELLRTRRQNERLRMRDKP